MAVKVAYKHGTKQTYLGLTERSPYALYWCTDTRELFKGDDLYSDGVRMVDSYTALPAFEIAADGILYVCKDSGNGYVLNESRDGWVHVIHSVDNETIGINENGFIAVKKVQISAIDGLEDRLTSIEQSVVSGAPIATTDVAGIVKASEEVAVAEDGAMSIVSIPQTKVDGLVARLENIEAAAVGGVHYKGSVPTFEDLPEDPTQGDLYEIETDNSEWCWNGEEWFEYGNTSGLKPIARCDINEAQFEISDDVLNIKSVDSAIVTYGEQSIKQALDDTIASITWEDMDGPTTPVDVAGGASVADALQNIADGGVIAMSDGEVSEALNIDKSVSVKGANAGIPQNFKQEV